MAVLGGESIRVMYPFFSREGEGGSSPTSPLEMRVVQIPNDKARALNQLWHSRLPRIDSPFIRSDLCFGAEGDNILYAVAIWDHPVARHLPQQEWLELRRLAVAPDAPRYTPSWMLGVMTRRIRTLYPHVVMLVSYQDTEVHTGTIYRAAGWVPTRCIDRPSASWSNTVRQRPPDQSLAPKQRWEKRLRPTTTSVVSELGTSFSQPCMLPERSAP